MTDTIRAAAGTTSPAGRNPFARSVSGSLEGDGTITIEDLEGRRIELRTPNALAPFRLVAAIGERAKNQHYVAMLTPLLAVSAVDGTATEPLDSIERIEALILRLGNAGVQAVSHAMLSELQRLMTPVEPAGSA